MFPPTVEGHSSKARLLSEWHLFVYWGRPCILYSPCEVCTLEIYFLAFLRIKKMQILLLKVIPLICTLKGNSKGRGLGHRIWMA